LSAGSVRGRRLLLAAVDLDVGDVQVDRRSPAEHPLPHGRADRRQRAPGDRGTGLAHRTPTSITPSLRHNSATPTKPADNVNDA
jgi:hypothetical protein